MPRVTTSLRAARDESVASLPRPVDLPILQALKRGALCLVLAPRRSGKTELLRRTAAALQTEGWRCVCVDFLGLGGGPCTLSDLTADLTRSIAAQTDQPPADLGRALAADGRQGLTAVLRELLCTPAGTPCAFFLDELEAALSLPGSVCRSLFQSLRELACSPPGQGLPRLAIAACTASLRGAEALSLAGCTPERFMLPDLAFAELRALLPREHHARPQSTRWLQAVYRWLGGQPWLLRLFCSHVHDALSRGILPKPAAFAFSLSRLQVGSMLHLGDLRACTRREPELAAQAITLYADVLGGARVNASEQDPLHGQLLLAGLLAQDEQGGRLVLRARNQLLARRFPPRQLEEELGCEGHAPETGPFE